MRAKRFGGVLALAFVYACNTIAGLDGDFGLANDAGNVPDDDSGTIDGGGDDAASDVADDTTTTTEFCRSQGADVVWCDDFESTTTGAPFGWDNIERAPAAASVELLPGVGKDGSRGIRAFAGDSNVSRKANLWKSIPAAQPPTAFASYDLDFDFRVGQRSIPYIVTGALAFRQQGGGGLPYYGSAAYEMPPLGLIDCSDPPKPYGGVTVPEVVGNWHHAHVVMARTAGSTYGSSLTVDGIAVDNQTPIDIGTPNMLDVRVGILFGATQSGMVEVFIDNVVVKRR